MKKPKETQKAMEKEAVEKEKGNIEGERKSKGRKKRQSYKEKENEKRERAGVRGHLPPGGEVASVWAS